MPKLPVGIHELKVLFTFNSQQYINTGKKIQFNSPPYGTKFDEIVKLDEADFKNKGKIMTGANTKKAAK